METRRQKLLKNYNLLLKVVLFFLLHWVGHPGEVNRSNEIWHFVSFFILSKKANISKINMMFTVDIFGGTHLSLLFIFFEHECCRILQNAFWYICHSDLMVFLLSFCKCVNNIDFSNIKSAYRFN